MLNLNVYIDINIIFNNIFLMEIFQKSQKRYDFIPYKQKPFIINRFQTIKIKLNEIGRTFSNNY